MVFGDYETTFGPPQNERAQAGSHTAVLFCLHCLLAPHQHIASSNV